MNASDAPLANNGAPEPIEDLASAMLDEQAALDTAAVESLSSDERRRLVDLQWLDALLTHGSPVEMAATERSVASVLASLTGVDGAALLASTNFTPVPNKTLARREQDKNRAGRRRWLPAISLSSLAAAALVMIAIGVWWQRGAQQAMAMVERSYQAALAPRDRTYDVTVTRLNNSLRPIKAKLTVRGSDKFLFEKQGPLGAMIRLGTDGRGYWFIPPKGPIVRAETDAFLPAWMRRTSTDLPSLQVSTLLARMRDYYRLKRLPDESLTADGPLLSHLQATWSAGELKPSKHGRTPPEEVELWADPTTGVVEQLTLMLPIDAVRRQAHTVTLRLAEEKNLGDEVYRAETYAPDRDSVDTPVD
jgi:hypothetical protein